MKIGIVTHKLIKGDGQGRINYEIAQEALRRRHKVVLIASEVATELESHPSAFWVRIPVASWPSELLRNQVFAWRSFRWLRRHRHQLDVLHVNGFITWAASDVNVSNFVHGAWLRSPVHTARLRRDLYGAYQWFYTIVNAYLERRAYRQAKMVVAAAGKNLRNELVEIGVPSKDIQVIPNGVDLEEFSPAPADRKKLDLPKEDPLALFAGDIRTPRKNLDTVLHALVEVPGLHLVVAGSTEGSPYPQLASQLGLTSRVHFLGYRRDMAELMRAADLFVFPSRYEAYALVVLEAMASGLPVVTTVAAGSADLVSPECGFVIEDPSDIDALREALKWLVQYPESRNSMGRAARAVVEQHSWQQMAERYLRLYEEIRDYEKA